MPKKSQKPNKGPKAAPKAGQKMGKLEKAKAAGRRASVIALNAHDAKAAGARQNEQELALAMQQDYLKIVSGEKVWLWKVKGDVKRSHAVDITKIEGGVDYWTKGGTKIKWQGDKISFNDSTTISYEETVKSAAARAIQMAEAGEEEAEEDEEVTISLKETTAFGGMQLQEVRGAVYVRDLFAGGSAEKAEVKVAWKVTAVKGIPFHTLFELSDKYKQFKIKNNDLVPFTFDASEKSNLFLAVADDSGAGEALGQYRAERGVPYREQWDPGSTEVGKLRMGDTIQYTEACSDVAGRTFLKFAQDGKDVWVSAMDEETGDILMERLNDDGTDRNAAGQQKKHGDYYRVHEKADVQASSDPDSKCVDGEPGSPATCVEPGEILEVSETVKVRGIEMIHCTKGWVRLENEQGGTIAKRVQLGETMKGVEPPSVVAVDDPEQTYMWDVFDTERQCDVTVDTSLRTVCRKELQVRTLSLGESEAVRVRIRKIGSKRQPAAPQNEETIIDDVNKLLQGQKDQLFTGSEYLKQDHLALNFKKPIRSLMDVEMQTSYITSSGNTLERKDLQTVTVGGRFDLPVQNCDPEKAWVWMSRAKVHAATASTIHMLSGIMSSKPDEAGSPRDGTPRGRDEPVLIFFVRKENTHPGTVKRMNSGTFKYCAGGVEPHLLVTQCQTSSEKFGEIEKGTWWQAIGKAAVRTGAELDTAKVGSLQPGMVIETLATETSENGSVRVRFDTGKLRGWASVATADGTVLMDEVTPEAAAEVMLTQGDIEMDSDDEDEDDDGGSDPNAGRYRVVKKSTVRAKFDMKSPKVGDPLEVDEEIVVTRGKVNQDTGQLRLKFARGWTSLKNAEGVDLLEKLEDPPAAAADGDGDDDSGAADASDGLEQGPEPEVQEMTAYEKMAARNKAAEEEEEEVDEGDFTPMEQYLDAFLSQEIVCKYGLFESLSDDGKSMTMPAIAFHCAKLESAEHLTKKREKIINPHSDAAKPVAAEARFEAGALNITLKGTTEVAVTSKDPKKKTSVRYLMNVDNKNEKGEGASWIITKSYAHFIQLDSTLRKALGPNNEKLLAPLPSKHSKHKGDKEAVVAERKKAVESYIVLATMHPMIAMHASFHEFCNSDKSEMEYAFAEEEEVVDEGPNTVIEKIDGVDHKSADKDVEQYLELKEASAETTKFIVEDDHAAFPSKEKLASMCNRLENGRGASDTFLTPTVGRAVSRLMLWSYAHTWCATSAPHESSAKTVHDVMERGETPSEDELGRACAAFATQAGRDAFRTVCSKLTVSYWEDAAFDAAKALIEAVLSAVVADGDGLTGSVVVDLVQKMGFKREVRKHTAWQDLSFWGGVLSSKIEEAQGARLQQMLTIAGDSDRAAEASDEASKETKALLLQMLEFRVPKPSCAEFLSSAAALTDLLTAEDRTAVEGFLADLEEESDDESEDEIAEGVPPDAEEEEDDMLAVMEEDGEEEEEDDHEEEDEQETPQRTDSQATEGSEGGGDGDGEDVYDGGSGLSAAEIARMAQMASTGGAPPPQDEDDGEEDDAAVQKAAKFGSAGLFANTGRSKVKRGGGSDSSSSSSDDSDDSDDIGEMPSPASSPGGGRNKMMRRPMNAYESTGGQTKGSMARRASLAQAAMSGPSSPGRLGGLGGRTLSGGSGGGGKDFYDKVITPTTSRTSSGGDSADV
jgi:hypothetical protein